MAYLLNSVDLSTYGIVASQFSGSNIALEGCFDLPVREQPTFHQWGDEDGIEAYTDVSDIRFTGRDIAFKGTVFGSNSVIYNYLDSFHNAISAFSNVVVLSSPYGNYSVYVKQTKVTYNSGACEVDVSFREPVVTLSGGSLPASGISDYTIDSIPFASFGLYVSKPDAVLDLPKMQETYFTKYGTEGYQIAKRSYEQLKIKGFIIASSVSDFQNKIKALYLLFSSAGERYINLNNEIYRYCFADEGFTVRKIIMGGDTVTAEFNTTLKVTG